MVPGFLDGCHTRYATQYQKYLLSPSFPSEIIFFACHRIKFIIARLISVAGWALNPRKRLKNLVFGKGVLGEYGRKLILQYRIRPLVTA